MGNNLIERVFLPATGSVLEDIINFACAMVEIVPTDGDTLQEPSGWATRWLIEQGVIGWNETDGAMRGWWLVNGFTELNRYGQPKAAFCRTQATASGEIVRRISYEPGKGMHIIRANTLAIPPRLFMASFARLIEQAERLLWTNMRASTRSQLIGAPKDQVETVRGILEDANNGDASVIETTIAQSLSSLDLSVPFMGNDIHQLLTSLYSDAYRRFGGVTPPQYKAERQQSAEIAAQIASTIDNVYIMIDTFNDGCERYGVPRKMVYRGYGARWDTDAPAEAEKTPDENQPDEEVPT